jgi:hypothetical protein
MPVNRTQHSVIFIEYTEDIRIAQTTVVYKY